MSTTYTTGEAAKLCGVSARTVQYYDEKGLLHPSSTTEGGNRLYSEGDVSELRFILLLKSLGLTLSQIRGVISSPNRTSVAAALLEEQRSGLAEDIASKQRQLDEVNAVLGDIKLTSELAIRSQSDMASHMENRKAFRKFAVVMVSVGILVDVAWIGTLIFAIVTGNWWAFACGLTIAIIAVSILVNHYWKHVTYLCPACGGEFKPRFWKWFFAGHTPKTRKLTCACCGTKDWCVERWHASPVGYAAGTCIRRDHD